MDTTAQPLTSLEQWAYDTLSCRLSAVEQEDLGTLPLFRQFYRLASVAHGKRQYHLRDICNDAGTRLMLAQV